MSQTDKIIILTYGEQRPGTADPLRDVVDALGSPEAPVGLVGISFARLPVYPESKQGESERSLRTLKEVDEFDKAGVRQLVCFRHLELDLPRMAFSLRRHTTQRVLAAEVPESPSETWARSVVAGDPSLTTEVEPYEPPAPLIETERLQLTWPTDEQSQGYYDDIIGTDIFDTLCWDGPSSPEDLLDSYIRAKLESTIPELSRTMRLAIIEKESDRQIGGISYRHHDERSVPQGDIGYAIAAHAHNKGYGTEAIKALVQNVFETTDTQRIEAEVFLGNDASARVLQKCGFAFEGTNRRRTMKHGKMMDEWLYAVLRD